LSESSSFASLQGAHIQCDVARRALLSLPLWQLTISCGSFNVQDLLKVSLGIESVDVHSLVLSKQIKLVEGDAIRAIIKTSQQGLGFFALFQQGLRQIIFPIGVHVG